MELLKELRGLGLEVRTRDLARFLRDESRLRGQAFAVARAFDKIQVAGALLACSRHRVPVTVSAGRTSITGASVPLSGIVLDISPLAGFSRDDPHVVKPGTILGPYRETIDQMGFFYPPDPTSEDSCAIGGNVACNASGALSYLYGPTRDYIEGLEIALINGAIIRVDRGDVISERGWFHPPKDLFNPPAKEDVRWPTPDLEQKSWRERKNAAGFFCADPMDLVDMFIGSEGVLGVITDIRVKLLPKRKPYFALMLYTSSRSQTIELVQTLDLFRRVFVDKDHLAGERLKALIGDSNWEAWRPAPPNRDAPILPACMEYFSASCAKLLSAPRAQRLAKSYGAIFIEQEHEPHLRPWDCIDPWNGFIELFNGAICKHGKPLFVEAALDPRGIREMRHDRLMVPERLNQLITPGMVKIGTDFATPMESLDTVLKMYEDMLPHGISYTFGHIGNAHVHTNITPGTEEERLKVEELTMEMARRVCELGGTISAEHGAGKIKRRAIELMFGPGGVRKMLKVKRALDPNLILNRGNIFECRHGTGSL